MNCVLLSARKSAHAAVVSSLGRLAASATVLLVAAGTVAVAQGTALAADSTAPAVRAAPLASVHPVGYSLKHDDPWT
ncbi:hypothetical protein F7Q99_11900 [Streptomyces kaniharaensis]|uniref:Uncharacterized protein n=1 Tax=Streptomyces kaniharaensis TaxID=212423 RepID=A0A6N7KQF8_9ACTN|nr:hypothetical protein [Streptomyces kaniharaensis]MQS12975.1 hypothetical protein [Streptomyces kaniharaensis]